MLTVTCTKRESLCPASADNGKEREEGVIASSLADLGAMPIGLSVIPSEAKSKLFIGSRNRILL